MTVAAGKLRRLFGFGDDLGEVPDCVAKRRQLGAIVQHDRLSEPQAPGHNATPQQNRIQVQYRPIRSAPAKPYISRPILFFRPGTRKAVDGFKGANFAEHPCL
jgi:hypothetical protein